nr:AAA domain-containing protein [Paenisporosarcina sp. TG-14]
MSVVKSSDVTRCNLSVSSRFRRSKPKMAEEMTSLLNASPILNVHMERLSDGQVNQKRVSLYIESETVSGTPVMECEWIGNGLEVAHFYVTKKRLQLGNNRHMKAKMAFDRKGLVSTEMTLSLYRIIQALPIASEQSEYVKKRISSWESYLRVMERNADVERLEIGIRGARISLDFRKVTFELQKLPNGFDKYYRKSAVKLVETNQNLGSVVQVQMGKRTIDVELGKDLQEKAREGKWRVPVNGKLAFDNVAEMAQINRLKDGFKRLENGWAVNPNLEKLLFEKRPTVRKGKVPEDLTFKQNLNDFQRQAVEGAMAAQDLYVIQGPPGTGKTTVISEICYQHAKMGLKTLVASQSNLAVDNALGKLLTDQEIRILRIGRTESIEEEGQRFVEEQVALYWKHQTLSSIQTHVNQFEKNGPAIQIAIEKTQGTLDTLLTEKAHLELQLEEKREAEVKLDHLKREVSDLHSTVAESYRKKEAFETQVLTSREILKEAQNHYKNAKEQVTLFNGTDKFSTMQAKIQLEMNEIENQLKYLDAELSLTDKKIDRQVLVGKLKAIHVKELAVQVGMSEVTTVKKLADLKELMGDESWTYSHGVLSVKRQLEKQQFTYEKLNQTFKGSPEVDDTLNKAIDYAEQKLNAQHYNMKMLAKKIMMNPLLDKSEVTDSHVKELVDEFRDYVKKMYGFREPLNKTDRMTLSTYYENLMIAKKSRDAVSRSKRVTNSDNEQLKKEILQTFELLKEAVGQAMAKRLKELSEEFTSMKSHVEKKDSEISEWDIVLSDLRKNFHHKGSFGTEVEMKKEFAEKQRLLVQMGTEDAFVDSLVRSMNSYNEKVSKQQQEITQFQDNIAQLEQQMDVKLANQAVLKEQMPQLEVILALQVEDELKRIHFTCEETVLQLDELQRKETFLSVSNDIRLEWKSMLEESTAYDLDEIKKLYIQYANVIGVTCSISASKDFVNQYPDFDVVIIDEVSKATPPELLLPMLKGKKIILVGDHHQLPPLVGQDTMDETLEDIKDPTEKAELKSILKESIFERLFKDLPEDSKTTLRIQYRMHEHIMETINPFYREKNYGLACGLVNSNKERDHLLDGKLFKRGQHILWYDMPNERGFLEEREQHSRSYYNAAELKQIRELLLDLNEATASAKREGRLDHTVKKKVGIISFYGEQVKKVNRLLSQELDLPHLHCRTGTVDKFQGMEMDVIILSFVRNHHQPDGNIGFLKDYRRLNVALSRARELLMIVGSVDMFTQKAHGESQKAMFQHVLKVVKQHEGLKQLETSVGRK